MSRESARSLSSSAPPTVAWRPALAELVGTFFLVLVVHALIVSASWTGAGPTGLATIALGAGATYGALVTVFAPVSGGHLNPAMTIAAASAGRLSPALAGIYVAAQVVGAALGVVFATSLLPPDAVANVSGGAPVAAPGVESGKLFALELVFAAFVAVVYFAVALRAAVGGVVVPAGRALHLGLAAGVAVFVATYVLTPLTGAGLNPGRVLGAWLVLDGLENVWLYAIAGVGGGLLGGNLVRLLWVASDDAS